MRKKLLIGLALYLAVGVVFGLVTQAHDYMCRDDSTFLGQLPTDGKIEDPGLDRYSDGTLDEAPWGCFPILDGRDRARWVAMSTPAWVPLLAREIVRGDGVAIGPIILGGPQFPESNTQY